MKAALTPVYFKTSQDPDFTKQLDSLRGLFAQEAEFLEPVPLGAPIPRQADALVFPQMLGDAYRRLEQFKALNLPVLVITSEFGTVSMWDWEINRYLRGAGVQVIAPYNLVQARLACRLRAQARAARGQIHRLPGQPRRGLSGPASSSASTGGKRSAARAWPNGLASGGEAQLPRAGPGGQGSA